jgi:ribosome maturation protein SDO1
MGSTIARIKKAGKHFEILVDMDAALAFKKGEGNVADFLETDKIFSDSKKGESAPSADVKESFGSEDIEQIAGTIVKEGEILVSQEHRSEEQEQKIKQVVDFLSRNAIDPQTGNPITTERIKNALNESHINIKNTTVESQINDILLGIGKIIPIKIETKKVKIKIPAAQTGQAYGVINQYKDKEDWLDDGSLEVVVNVPAGMIMDFYDKLNDVTHGSALTEEITEKNE